MPTKAASPTVLVVEDDEGLLGVIGDILVHAGFDFLPATDGLSAMRQARTRWLDVALVDLNIPGRSGRQVVEELLRHSPDLPVVVMTGERDASVPVGASLLRKPFGIEPLLHCLRDVPRRGAGAQTVHPYSLGAAVADLASPWPTPAKSHRAEGVQMNPGDAE